MTSSETFGGTNETNRTLWLVRHGTKFKKSWNPDHEWPLSELGLRQADSVADFFENEFKDRKKQIVSLMVSPFLRTVQTAAPTAKRLNLSMQLESGLWESRCKPVVSGCLSAEYLKDVPIDSSYETSLTPTLPEDPEKYFERTQKIAAIVSQLKTETVIISHASVISGLIFHLLQAASPKHIPAIRECSITKLVQIGDGPWQLDTYAGSVSHLKELGWDRYSFERSTFWQAYHDTYK